MTAFTYLPSLHSGFCAVWERYTRLQYQCRSMGQHFLAATAKHFFYPFLRVALVLVWHHPGPTPDLVSCMSWFTSATLQELESMNLVGPFQLRIFSDSMIVIKPSSLMSATLVQQREHKHADEGRGWHCPSLWQLAIGAIYWYYQNMSFAVLSLELWWLIWGWLQTPLPSNPAKCLTSDGRRAEDVSFPNALTEDGSSRNQTWHLLHVALGPRAVSCSSMEQTCLLLHCLVCGEQQTPGRGGDRHCYRFVIIKHQEPGVRAWARSGGILICTILSMLPANFQCPLPPLPPAHKGWVIRSSVFIPRYR